jgi:CBS domain containing-hemolysin-like protein
METLELTWRSIAGVALMLGNAYFVAVEFALTRLGEFDDDELREAGAKTAADMQQELEFHLTGCQVGITFTSILLGVVAEPALTYALMPIFEFVGIGPEQAPVFSVVAAVVVINLIHTVWGEQAPTYLGVERPKQVARWLAPTLRYWTKLVFPLIYVGDKLAKATLGVFGVSITRSWVEAEGGDDDGSSAGSKGDVRGRLFDVLADAKLGDERREEVLRAYEIGERPVGTIMVERDDMVVLQAEASPEDIMTQICDSMHTRYVVVGADRDDVVGVLYLPLFTARIDDVRSGDVGLVDLVAPPVDVAPDLSISDFIDRLQAASEELAVVRDDGRVLGMVTATDGFEAVMGELEDPLDKAA